MIKFAGILLALLLMLTAGLGMATVMMAPPTPEVPPPGRCAPGDGGGGGGSEGGEGTEVPEHAWPWLEEAHKTSGIPVEWLAAVIDQESDFRPDLFADDVNGGTWGLYQINAEEWSKVTNGGNFDNPDIRDPMIHSHYAGLYFKDRLENVKRMQEQNPDQEYSKIPPTDALVIAHNAGEGNLKNYPDNLPSITKKYLENIRRAAGKIDPGKPAPCPPEDQNPPPGGGGNAPPPDDPGEYADLVAGKEGGVDPWNFYWGQCTSYVAWAVRTYSPHKDFSNSYLAPRWGNAKQWRDAAKQAGLKVDQTPVVGSVAVRQSGSAGHVAFVVGVNDDGTFLINEYNHVVREGFSTRTVRMGEDFNDIIHFEIPPNE